MRLLEKRLSVMNFIKLLDDAEVTENLISRDTVSDMIAKIAVPQNKKQMQFYSDRLGCKYSELELDPNGKIQLEGDPGLYYYEFCMCLCRVGLEVTKDIEEMRKSIVKFLT